MVRLPNYSSKFIKDYCLEIGDEVYRKALANISFWKKYFPESYDGMTLNKQFFIDILSLPMEEICAKYSSVKKYFDFAFFASLSIKRIHAAERSRKIRENNRKKYIVEFVTKNVCALDLLKDFMTKKDPTRNDNNFIEFQHYMKKFLDVVNSQIQKSINYSAEINRKHRVNILDELNIKVCPYCNRQYIVKLDINVGMPIGDIDHFYSQNYFALFGLSLYNFVPSCKICNSLFKSDINADIQYPYKMDEECNIVFKISDSKGRLSPGVLFGWNEDIMISVVEDVKNSLAKEKARREIKFFELEAQYEIHKEYVRDFLYKKNMIDGSVISNMQTYFKKQGITLSEQDTKEIIYGFNVDHIILSEKPLAKLTKDLYERY